MLKSVVLQDCWIHALRLLAGTAPKAWLDMWFTGYRSPWKA